MGVLKTLLDSTLNGFTGQEARIFFILLITFYSRFRTFWSGQNLSINNLFTEKCSFESIKGIY